MPLQLNAVLLEEMRMLLFYKKLISGFLLNMNLSAVKMKIITAVNASFYICTYNSALNILLHSILKHFKR